MRLRRKGFCHMLKWQLQLQEKLMEENYFLFLLFSSWIILVPDSIKSSNSIPPPPNLFYTNFPFSNGNLHWLLILILITGGFGILWWLTEVKSVSRIPGSTLSLSHCAYQSCYKTDFWGMDATCFVGHLSYLHTNPAMNNYKIAGYSLTITQSARCFRARAVVQPFQLPFQNFTECSFHILEAISASIKAGLPSASDTLWMSLCVQTCTHTCFY